MASQSQSQEDAVQFSFIHLPPTPPLPQLICRLIPVWSPYGKWSGVRVVRIVLAHKCFLLCWLFLVCNLFLNNLPAWLPVFWTLSKSDHAVPNWKIQSTALLTGNICEHANQTVSWWNWNSCIRLDITRTVSSFCTCMFCQSILMFCATANKRTLL